MKLDEFVSYPKFIDKYIENGDTGLSILVNDFCKVLIEINTIQTHVDDNGKNIYYIKVGDNYTIRRFVDFYIDKSKLSCKYECKYEDELDLPKSILNEVFVVGINGKPKTLYIDSYNGDTIKLINS